MVSRGGGGAMQRRGARSRAAARPCAASTQPGYSDQPVQVRLLILRRGEARCCDHGSCDRDTDGWKYCVFVQRLGWARISPSVSTSDVDAPNMEAVLDNVLMKKSVKLGEGSD